MAGNQIQKQHVNENRVVMDSRHVNESVHAQLSIIISKMRLAAEKRIE